MRCGLCQGLDASHQVDRIANGEIMCAICKRHYHDVHPLARVCKRCFEGRQETTMQGEPPLWHEPEMLRNLVYLATGRPMPPDPMEYRFSMEDE